ncbi:efflux RND transporter periplasmic adaptor subunit [Sulfuricurvum sp.]|uniref:efflux RND transporter periplasmic adaptor subunit n=1 Tax=Sulfuricurvum sp. TaxID=2025608 RepID=UPI0026125531|nr:efflux RND transporter periplasmic adaptor subunit [Sulfuricurvum sp.]MDD2267703.1 efflux RND transporter periplasmic adaptor subunit [Sulfuricurvum sp.]MDD2949169.1 efflux RND transporter periplasmic adaptor subunit [Sulfuricurvum sp.]
MKKLAIILTCLTFFSVVALNAQVIATVSAQKATVASLEKSVRGYGSIDFDPLTSTTLSLESGAKIVAVKVVPGQKVKKGEIVATIAPSESDVSALRLATISVEYGQKEKNRVSSMRDAALATNADVELASQNLDKALQTKAELSKKLHSAIGGTLKSPINGVIQSIMIKNGDIVSAQMPLILIGSANHLIATLGIEPSSARDIRMGQKVIITPSSSSLKPHIGSIVSLSSQIDPKSRLVSVRIQIPSSKDFMAGTSISGEIVTGSERGIVLPSTAIITRNNVHYCFVVMNQKALLRKVRVGNSHNGNTLILEGIRSNDHVITLGNYECENGMRVNVMEKVH